MPTRSQNIKLGVFMVATFVLLVLVIVFVGNLRFWRVEHPYYVISEESVAGLELGSPVTMRGVDVGRIDAIRLDPRRYDRVEVRLSIEGDIPIPADAKALIQFSGLTGLKVIDIAGGSTQDGTLPPGSVIPVGETTFALLETRAEELVEHAREIMEGTQALVDNLVKLSEAIDAERVGAIVDRVDTIITTVGSASQELEAALGESRTSLREVFDDVEKAGTRLQDLLQRGSRVVQANDGDVRAAVRDLREAARNLEALSRQVRRNPSSLLRSRPPKERELP